VALAPLQESATMEVVQQGEEANAWGGWQQS